MPMWLVWLERSPALPRIFAGEASGALDEAHSVIDMLRHPEDARLQLAANDAEASLTRDSLLQLIGDARAANMRIDT